MMKTKKKSVSWLVLLLVVWACTEQVPGPIEESVLVKQTNLEAEPLLGQMVSSLRSDTKASRNPDGEQDLFSRVNWNNVSLYEDQEKDLSLYTATFLEDEASFTDNMVVGGTVDEPFAYVVRYKPNEGIFDGKLSTFTGTIEMYTVEGERFGYTELLNGESQLHLRGSSANEQCYLISFEVVEDCSTAANDYCTEISYMEVEICMVSGGSDPGLIGVPDSDGGSGGGSSGDRAALVPMIKELPSSDKPCPKDPVKEPEVAPQTNSGINGGMFGKTRNQGKRQHNGLDLKADYGDPIYAMYDGSIYSAKYQANGAGYFTRIQSTVNGKTFLTEYFHLQKDRRVTSGTVNAGDIIGYLGDSGNLKNAIDDGYAVSHLHIGVLEHDGSNKWAFNNYKYTDPKPYLATEIDDNGNVTKTVNCN